MLYFLKGGDEVPIAEKGSEAVGNHGCGTNWLLHCLASHISSLSLSFYTGYYYLSLTVNPQGEPGTVVNKGIFTFTGAVSVPHSWP